MRAASFRSRSGIAPTFPIEDCSSGTRPARRCRSCGRMPSTSSCVDPFRTGRSSIGRRRLFSGTWLRRGRLATSPGASTIRFAQCRAGRTLRVETLAPAVVHWSVDGWRTVHDTYTSDTTLGVHVADLQTLCLRIGDRVDFTLLLARDKAMGRDRFCRLRGMTSADSTMAGQFMAVRALDRVRDPVENHIRPRVEQDEMASQKTILDVVRKPRQRSQDVGWHCESGFPSG